jgi:hypothetical protein
MNMKTKGRIFAIFATVVEALLGRFRGANDRNVEGVLATAERRRSKEHPRRSL